MSIELSRRDNLSPLQVSMRLEAMGMTIETLGKVTPYSCTLVLRGPRILVFSRDSTTTFHFWVESIFFKSHYHVLYFHLCNILK